MTHEEMKESLFSILDDKALRLDDYTYLIFNRSWNIIGEDFTIIVRYFFDSSILFRSVNATRIALIPKVEISTTMNDFRSILCCYNVMYKCIFKVIVNKLKGIFPKVIGHAHAIFVPGRKIFDFILLTQELMHNYHLASSMTKCALKIDIKKAFDMISWDFILMGLKAIGVPG
jgi:hypothetical protein